MRKPLIAGNWKMNLTLQEAIDLAAALKSNVGSLEDVGVLVCPPFVYLAAVGQVLKGSPIKLGAQDMYFQEQGAFTGEISGGMLKEVACESVILGHSERRHILGEDDALINRKVGSAIQQGLHPILCVGELLEQREEGSTEKVLTTQVEKGLAGLSADEFRRVTVAYEPVWAIGTGRTATPEQAQEAQALIRSLVEKLSDRNCAQSMMILYGGSVKPDNIAELAGQPDIDGALVGGASLKADSFSAIIRSTREVYSQGGKAGD